MTIRLLVSRAAFAALLVLLPSIVSADAGAPSSSSPPSTSATAKPDVATLLFGTPMWDKAPPGAKVRYAYAKSTSDAALGEPFKDEVVLTLGPGDDAKSRTVEMQLFSGSHRKPAGPFRSDEQNPVLLVVLEDNVQELSKLFKANPRYIKNAIRKAWRDNAKIEPAQDTIDGKPVAVTRISVSPFLNDAEADKMKGLQTMSYVVDVSNEIPGYIAAVQMTAMAQDKTLFEESLHFVSETKP